MSRDLVVNRFTTTAQGLVPAPGAATGRLLRDDGTWENFLTVANTGGITINSPASGPALTVNGPLKVTSSSGPAVTAFTGGFYQADSGGSVAALSMNSTGAAFGQIYNVGTQQWALGYNAASLTIPGTAVLTWDSSGRVIIPSSGVGSTTIGQSTAGDSILQVNGALAGLRVGYSGTSSNYYDADNHNFRGGNGAATMLVLSTSYAACTYNASSYGTAANQVAGITLNNLNATMQTVVEFQKAGVINGRIRSDSAGSMTYVATGTGNHAWMIGGDSGVGTNVVSINGGNGLLTATNGIVCGGVYKRSAAGQGWLDGGYSSIETGSTSGAIYSIGGGTYLPGTTTLGNMYGIGYTTTNTTGISASTGAPANTWGMYVASGGTARIFLASDTGFGYFGGGVTSGALVRGFGIYSDQTLGYCLSSADATTANGGKVVSQSGGVASGGNPGDIRLIY